MWRVQLRSTELTVPHFDFTFSTSRYGAKSSEQYTWYLYTYVLNRKTAKSKTKTYDGAIWERWRERRKVATEWEEEGSESGANKHSERTRSLACVCLCMCIVCIYVGLNERERGKYIFEFIISTVHPREHLNLKYSGNRCHRHRQPVLSCMLHVAKTHIRYTGAPKQRRQNIYIYIYKYIVQKLEQEACSVHHQYSAVLYKFLLQTDVRTFILFDIGIL